jgi:hypothetical protein
MTYWVRVRFLYVGVLVVVLTLSTIYLDFSNTSRGRTIQPSPSKHGRQSRCRGFEIMNSYSLCVYRKYEFLDGSRGHSVRCVQEGCIARRCSRYLGSTYVAHRAQILHTASYNNTGSL